MKRLLLLFVISLISSYTLAEGRHKFSFQNGESAYLVTDDSIYTGVKDESGNLIIPKVFKRIGLFGNILVCSNRKDSKDRYYSIYDYKGNCILPESEKVSKIDGLIVNKQHVLSTGPYSGYIGAVLDINGNFLYKYKNCKDSKGFYYLTNEVSDTIVARPYQFTGMFYLSYDVIMYKTASKKIGAMNFDGSVIIPPILYGGITPDVDANREQSLGFNVRTSSNYDIGFAGYYDRDGKCIFPADKYEKIHSLSNGMFEVELDGKAGIADSLGNVKFMTKYDGLTPKKDEEGKWYYITYLSNGKGRITSTGIVIEEPKPTVRKKEYDEGDFKYIQIIDEKGSWGIQSIAGDVILPCEYKSIYYRNSYIKGFLIIKNGYAGFADKDGKIIIPCNRYHDITSIGGEGKYFIVEYNGLYGLCDKDGTELINPLYNNITVKDNLVYAEVGIMEGVLDLAGNLIVPFEYTSVYLDKQTGNFNVELFKKKGICDKNGKLIIPPLYSSVYKITGKDYYHIADGQYSGLYSLNGRLIFPATTYSNVFIRDSRGTEYEGKCEKHVIAYNDFNERYCIYDLNGNLLFDSKIETIFNNYFESAQQEFDNKNYNKAIQLYNSAIKVKADEYAYYNIGAAYYNLGEYKNAIKSLNSCLQVCKSQSLRNDANDLIIDCRESIQNRRANRANIALGILGGIFNVANTIVQTNNAIQSYNSNTSYTPGNNNFYRNTNMDYLIDPQYTIMQVNRQNWEEYLNTTNGGRTMSYEEWYAIKAQAILDSNKSSSSLYSSDKLSTNGNKANNTTNSSGKNCDWCAGSGNCNTCNGKGWFYGNLGTAKPLTCPNCYNHDGKCTHCKGKGRIY